MNDFFLPVKHFFFPRRTACRLNHLSKIFALSVALIWLTNGLLPCCEFFSSRPANRHSNYVVAEYLLETQAPDSSPPLPCEPMEEHGAIVTDSTSATKIKNTTAIDCISSRPATVAIINHRPSILLTVYHPPPPSPFYLRTLRLLI